MSIFELYASYQYKSKTGELSHEEAFTYGFLSGLFLSMMLFAYNTYFKTTLYNLNKKKMMYIYAGLPVIFGIFYLIKNELTGQMYKAKLNNYTENGFSEKESKEQALADARQYTGSSGSDFMGGLLAGGMNRKRK